MKRTWKRVASSVLAFTLACSLVTTAFAADGGVSAELDSQEVLTEVAEDAVVEEVVDEVAISEEELISEVELVSEEETEADAVIEATEVSDTLAEALDATKEDVVSKAANEELKDTIEEADDILLSIASISTISAEETVEITISEEGGYVLLAFTPEKTGYYNFYSTGDDDTYGYLLDDDYDTLTYNDDGGENSNFSIVYSCTAGTTYYLKSRFYSSDQTGSFSVTVEACDTFLSGGAITEYYANIGDELTLEAQAYIYVYTVNSYIMVWTDLSEEQYSFAWYKDSYYQAGDTVLSTEATLTITVSENDFETNDTYYRFEIYEDGELLATNYCRIYNKSEYYSGSSQYYNVEVGDSVTLTAVIYDADEEEVDLSDDAFTFAWYAPTYEYSTFYDEDEDEWYRLGEKVLGECLGTGQTFTIDVTTVSDFREYSDCYYECRVYKNGTYVATTYCYLYENNTVTMATWNTLYGSVGESVTLSFTLYNENGDEIDISGEAYTFEWYKKSYCYSDDFESFEIVYSDVLATESTYTIDCLTEDDLYHSYGTTEIYYCCKIYKYGVEIYSLSRPIYDKNDKIYGSNSSYASVGETVTLEAYAYNYDYEDVDLTDDAYTVAWYKVYDYYDEDTDEDVYEITDVLGYGATYTIDCVEDSDFYSYSEDQWNTYRYVIYKNGTQLATCKYYLWNKEDSYYGGWQSYYQSSGSLTLEAVLYDYADEVVDLSDDCFTFEWYKYTEVYIYDDEGEWCDWYENTSDVLSTDRTYTISSLASDDLWSRRNGSYTYYYCIIYKNGKEVGYRYCYIYDPEYIYYDGYENVYGILGGSVTLEAAATDYEGNAADLTGDEFTFQWYQWISYYDENGDWQYKRIDLGTSRTVTLDNLSSYEFYDLENNVYSYVYCIIYKNGTRVAWYDCYLIPSSTNVSISSTSIKVGKTSQITVTDNTGEITYSSDNTSVATVNSSGKITAKAAGTATITVKEDDIKLISYTVTVSLAAPTISSVKNTTSGIKVTWGAVSGATSYIIYRSTSKSGTYSKVGTSTSTSFTNKTSGTNKISANKTYYYKVVATDGTNKSSKSSASSAIKFLKASVSKLTNTSSGVKITWSKVTGASGYYVYRGSTKIKTISSGSTVSYTDTSVKSKNAKKYTYHVVPYYTSSGSKIAGTYGNTKTIYRLVANTLSSVKNSASKTITVKWSKKSSVSGYEIYYSTSSSFSSYKSVKVSGASSASKKITGLKKGKTYYVKVRTYKKVSGTYYYSAWSSVKKVKVSK